MGQYFEAVEDDSRCSFAADQTGGTARAFYYNTSPDLQSALKELLGYTNPFHSLNRPSLDRTLPVTHPKFPWMYASRLVSLVGKGTGGASRVAPTTPSNPAIGAKPIADYLAYRQYEIGVEFSSRPYPVLANEAFTGKVTDGKWYTRDGTPNTFTYSPEWVRFADFDYTPQDNTVQGQQGSFTVWGVSGKTGGIPFNNPPWMWLPDQLLTIRMYGFPFRYITSPNSYIAGTPNRNWRGRVNQNPWWFWPAGSLLYLGYSVHKYTPPTSDIETYYSYLPTGADPAATGPLINYARLCDITLTFLYTTRYKSGSLGADILNKNHIAAGHNLLPYLPDNSFRYATRTPLKSSPPFPEAQAGTLGTASVQNPPAWYSFPAEVLFTDPDASGGPTTAGDN